MAINTRTPARRVRELLYQGEYSRLNQCEHQILDRLVRHLPEKICQYPPTRASNSNGYSYYQSQGKFPITNFGKLSKIT